MIWNRLTDFDSSSSDSFGFLILEMQDRYLCEKSALITHNDIKQCLLKNKKTHYNNLMLVLVSKSNNTTCNQIIGGANIRYLQ